MKVNGEPMRSIWSIDDVAGGVIDQSVLPYRVETRRIDSAAAAEQAIRTMVVRGAPLIGVTGAYGLALAPASVPAARAAARPARGQPALGARQNPHPCRRTSARTARR